MAKGPEAFRTISEASNELGVAQHVLRFWETKFSFLRPMKRAGGRRFYRPRDIEMLSVVKQFLYQDGLSIRDVQDLYRRNGVLAFRGGRTSRAARLDSDPDVSRLVASLGALEAAHRRLHGLLATH